MTVSPSFSGYDDLGTYNSTTGLYVPNARFTAATTTITYKGSSVPVGGTVTWNDNASNNTATTELHPQFAALSWETACAPLVISGSQLAAVRSHLAERALELGCAPSSRAA